MKTRLLFISALILTAFLLLSWRSVMPSFGTAAPDRIYDSPVGQFTLPTEDATAGTLGVDYQLASFLIGIPKMGPVVGDANGNTGNGFQDRYNYENINAFAIAQAGNNVGELDSLNPNNSVPGPGGQPINPGFRFVHISDQPFIWRIGSATDGQKAQQVIVFPMIDHLFDPETPGYGPNRMNPPPGGFGNVVLEATEFTVWGTDNQDEALNAARTVNYFGVGGTGNAPNNQWVRGRLVKVLAEGFKNYNGLSPFATRADGSTPSPQEGEDFASMWEFRDASGNPVAVKFVAVYANRTRDARFFEPDTDGNIPGILAQSGDAEIDAVGFIPFTPPPAIASISGRVINDANGNGAIDAGEAPIPGVTVTLFDAAGVNSVAVATTDASGSYSFANLVPASYRVVETNLPNYIDTGVLPGAGNAAVNLNTIAATLVGGQNSVENNFLDALPPVDCVPACYLDVDMWDINFAARQTAYARAGGIGNIFLLSLNRGAASDDEVIAVLEAFGGSRVALEREFVAAQLNAANYPGSVFNRATCFYLGANVPLKLPGNPRLIDVLNEARAVYATGTDLQIRTVTFQLATFNNITATAGIVCQFADP